MPTIAKAITTSPEPSAKCEACGIGCDGAGLAAATRASRGRGSAAMIAPSAAAVDAVEQALAPRGEQVAAREYAHQSAFSINHG